MPMKKAGLKKGILLFALVAIILPLAMIGSFFLSYYKQETIAEINHDNQHLAEIIRDGVSNSLQAPRRTLNSVVGLAVHHEYAPHIDDLMAQMARSYGFFESIMVLDRDGIVRHLGTANIAGLNRADYLGIDLSEAEHIATALRLKQPTWSDTYISTITGEPTLSLTIPFERGMVVGNFNFSDLTKTVERHLPQSQDRLYLVNSKGRIIAHPRRALVLQQVNVSNLPVVRAGLEGREGIYEYDVEGVAYIGAVAIIPETGWLVIVERDKGEVFHSYRNMQRVFAVVLAGALLLVAFFVGYINSRVVRPVVEISATTKNVADGYFLPANRYEGRFRELDDLTVNFNTMITALRDREQELRQSESKYRMLFESAADAIFLMEGDRFIDCNPGTLAMFRCTREQIIGAPPYRFSPPFQPDGRDSTEKALKKIHSALSGESQRFEWKHATYDGNPFDAEVTLNRVMTSSGVYLQAVVRDVSERKQVEEAVRQSEEKLKLILESSPFAVYVLGPDGKGLHVNGPATVLTGYDRDDLLHRHFLELVYPEDRDAIIKRREKRLQGADVESRYDFRIISRSGAVRWVENQVILLTWEGTPATVNFLQDITESRRIAEEQADRSKRIQRQQSGLVTMAMQESIALGDLEQADPFITENAARILMVERVGIWLLSEGGTQLRCVDLYEQRSGNHQRGAVLMARSYPRYFAALREGRAIDAHDARRDERTNEFTDGYLVPLGITSMLDAPIRLRGQVIGVICIEHVGDPRTWIQDEMAFAASCGDYVVLAMANEEKARAERALRNNEERLNTILDNVGAAIFIKDTHFRYTYVNRKVCEIFGKRAEEILGNRDEDFFSAATVEEIRRSDRPVIERGETVSREETGFAAIDTVPRNYWTTKLPLSDSGSIIGLCGISTDITDLKQAEKAMRASEERLSRIASCVPDLIWTIDFTGRFTYANSAVERIHGWTVAELLNLTFRDTASPPYVAKYQSQIEDELAKAALPQYDRNTVRRFESEEQRKDGSTFWSEISASLLWSDDDKPIGIIGITRDITQRKRAEEALAKSEERFRVAFSTNPDAIIISRIDNGILTDVNQGFTKLTGYTRDEVVNKYSARALNLWDVPAHRQQFLEDLQAKGAVDNLETRFRRKNGDVFSGSLSARLIMLNDVPHALSIGKDITERKRAEEEREKLITDIRQALGAVSRSQKEWQETFDSITDMISIHDKDFNIIKANKAFSANLGLTPREVINRKCYDLMHHGATAPVAECPHVLTLQRKEHVSEEVFDEKAKKVYNVSTYPYFSPNGEFIGSIHITRDITEDKEREMKMIMTERLASLGQMASGIAHEINNPLESVMICAELLLMRVAKDTYDHAQFEKYLKIIDEEVLRCRDITSNMLSFSRQTTLSRSDIDAHLLLDRAIDLVGYQGRLKNVTVTKKYGEKLLVSGNEGELRQVFLVLLINALDAMENKGAITVETGTETGSAWVRISDTGPGIAPDDLQRIFNPFYSTKTEKGGTGLGLSIAHRIATNHQGSLTVVSEQGRGATFTITLPR